MAHTVQPSDAEREPLRLREVLLRWRTSFLEASSLLHSVSLMWLALLPQPPLELLIRRRRATLLLVSFVLLELVTDLPLLLMPMPQTSITIIIIIIIKIGRAHV